MNSVLALVKNFEETVNELKSQKKHMISQFSMDGDGNYIICTDTIIGELKAAREAAIPECVQHYDQIIESFNKINEIVNEKNELISEQNQIIDEQIQDLHDEINKQLADVPELKMNKAIRIGKSKIDAKYNQVLEILYSKFGFTNIEKDDRRDFVYVDINENNNIRKDIIESFNVIAVDIGFEKIEIGNYIHYEPLSPEHLSDLIKVVKSRI